MLNGRRRTSANAERNRSGQNAPPLLPHINVNLSGRASRKKRVSCPQMVDKQRKSIVSAKKGTVARAVFRQITNEESPKNDRDARVLLVKQRRQSIVQMKVAMTEAKMAQKEKKHELNMKRNSIEGWSKVISLYCRLQIMIPALKMGRNTNTNMHRAAILLQRSWRKLYPALMINKILKMHNIIKPIAWILRLNLRAKRRRTASNMCRDFFTHYGPDMGRNR